MFFWLSPLPCAYRRPCCNVPYHTIPVRYCSRSWYRDIKTWVQLLKLLSNLYGEPTNLIVPFLKWNCHFTNMLFLITLQSSDSFSWISLHIFLGFMVLCLCCGCKDGGPSFVPHRLWVKGNFGLWWGVLLPHVRLLLEWDIGGYHTLFGLSPRDKTVRPMG